MATQRFGAISPGRLNNETTTAPTVNDDANAGYSIGSEWIDTTDNIVYKCVDTTAAAAIWVRAGESTAMMPMGEISFNGNSTATTITTTATWTKVGITTSLNVNDEFDSPSAGRLRYTGATTKTFHCGCTFSVKGAGANDVIAAILYKTGTVNGNNEYTAGTALTQGTTTQKLGAAGDVASTAIHAMVELATNDYIELAIQNTSDADDLTVTDMNVFAVAAPYTAATPGGSGAPSDADYLVKTTNASLSAERVVTDTTSISWDWATAGQAKASVITSWLINLIYPVGALYFSELSTNPGTLWGVGTWAAYGPGKTIVGIDAGDTDFDTVGETGGAKTVASAGSTGNESAHTHSVTSNVTVGDHASHTHTYTDVVNHTHSVNVGSANDTSTVTGSGNIFAGTTSSVTATTGNPSGGVASGTTAGPSATLTHTVTNNAVTSGAGSAHNHSYSGSATSVVQPYIVVYMWKRTA